MVWGKNAVPAGPWSVVGRRGTVSTGRKVTRLPPFGMHRCRRRAAGGPRTGAMAQQVRASGCRPEGCGFIRPLRGHPVPSRRAVARGWCKRLGTWGRGPPRAGSRPAPLTCSRTGGPVAQSVERHTSPPPRLHNGPTREGYRLIIGRSQVRILSGPRSRHPLDCFFGAYGHRPRATGIRSSMSSSRARCRRTSSHCPTRAGPCGHRAPKRGCEPRRPGHFHTTRLWHGASTPSPFLARIARPVSGRRWRVTW